MVVPAAAVGGRRYLELLVTRDVSAFPGAVPGFPHCCALFGLLCVRLMCSVYDYRSRNINLEQGRGT